jgi:hypothetical protein
MKVVSILTISFLCGTEAFSLLPGHVQNRRLVTLQSASVSSSTSTESMKKNLVEVAEQLKDEYGLFLIDKTAKERLKNAVDVLERVSDPPSFEEDKDILLGDWELVCTTAVSDQGIDTSKLPLFNQGPLKMIRDSIRNTANKYLNVEQRMRSENDNGVLDRVDHVLEYDPPSELQDVLDNLPDQLTTLNINPLQVSSSKFILVHKAIVKQDSPITIQLTLKSVVLNVAGKSTVLDPNGKDITSINLPLSEFLNSGEFETTYMDDELRISRGKQGFVDQLRVFLRKGKYEKDQGIKDVLESNPNLGKGVNTEMDVDDVVDPYFETEVESPSDVENSDS